MGIEAGRIVKFVTQDGAVLPTVGDIEYEEDKAELVFSLERKEDVENIDAVAKSAFESAGLPLDDVIEREDPVVVTDAEGNVFECELDLDAYDHFPLAIKVTVKRRKKPMTIASAFKLEN